MHNCRSACGRASDLRAKEKWFDIILKTSLEVRLQVTVPGSWNGHCAATAESNARSYTIQRIREIFDAQQGVCSVVRCCSGAFGHALNLCDDLRGLERVDEGINFEEMLFRKISSASYEVTGFTILVVNMTHVRFDMLQHSLQTSLRTVDLVVCVAKCVVDV